MLYSFYKKGILTWTLLLLFSCNKESSEQETPNPEPEIVQEEGDGEEQGEEPTTHTPSPEDPQPEPVEPKPFKLEPVEPKFVNPEPVKPEPVEPEPVEWRRVHKAVMMSECLEWGVGNSICGCYVEEAQKVYSDYDDFLRTSDRVLVFYKGRRLSDTLTVYYWGDRSQGMFSDFGELLSLDSNVMAIGFSEDKKTEAISDIERKCRKKK